MKAIITLNVTFQRLNHKLGKFSKTNLMYLFSNKILEYMILEKRWMGNLLISLKQLWSINGHYNLHVLGFVLAYGPSISSFIMLFNGSIKRQKYMSFCIRVSSSLCNAEKTLLCNLYITTSKLNVIYCIISSSWKLV